MRDTLRRPIQQAQAARKEAERSSHELERQNERLDEFASTLSHDLRNPLTVARGHVEPLATRLSDPGTDSAISSPTSRNSRPHTPYRVDNRRGRR